MSKETQTKYAVGMKVNGFIIREVLDLSNLRVTAYKFEHEKSGALYVHLQCEDQSIASISFNLRTPPLGDTGASHILEHMIFCGSERYPIRHPLKTMMSRTVAATANAGTGLLCTEYYAHSIVPQDILNIAEVYLDALFHPLLRREDFLREGWHLRSIDPSNPKGDLRFDGIVFNEMGAWLEDEETKADLETIALLLPDTYAPFEQGGRPSVIPTLTHEQVIEYHKKYYHPSNMLIFTSGKDDPAGYLELFDKELSGHTRREIVIEHKTQKSWSEPQETTIEYAPHEFHGEEEAVERASFKFLWKMPNAVEDYSGTIQDIIETNILKSPKFSLNDQTKYREPKDADDYCSTVQAVGTGDLVLRFSASSKNKGLDEVRTEIFEALEELCRTGLTSDMIESIRSRSLDYWRNLAIKPRVKFDYNVIGAWCYGVDPFSKLIEMEEMEEFVQRLCDNPSIITDYIRHHVLENPHRLDVSLKKGESYAKRRKKALSERMETLRATMSDAEIEEALNETAALVAIQETPDPPEILARLPTSIHCEIPPVAQPLPVTETILPCGIPFLRTDVFTNRINFLTLEIDLQSLPPHLWSYMTHYESMTNARKKVEEDQDIDHPIADDKIHFGSQHCVDRHAIDQSRIIKRFRFTVKVMDEYLEEAFALLKSKVLDAGTPDLEWIKKQSRENERSLSVTRTMVSILGLDGLIDDVVDNASELKLLKKEIGEWGRDRLLDKAKEDVEGVIDEIESAVGEIGDFVKNRGLMTASFAGSDLGAEKARRVINEIGLQCGEHPVASVATSVQTFTPSTIPRMKGVVDDESPMGNIFGTSTDTMLVIPTRQLRASDNALISIGLEMLREHFLFKELRLKNHCYGAMCGYVSAYNAIIISTSADPDMVKTYRIYRKILEYLKASDWDMGEIKWRAKKELAAYSKKPRVHHAASYALDRRFLEVDKESAQTIEALKSISAESVAETLRKAIEAGWDRSCLLASGSRKELERLQEEFGDAPTEILEW